MNFFISRNGVQLEDVGAVQHKEHLGIEEHLGELDGGVDPEARCREEHGVGEEIVLCVNGPSGKWKHVENPLLLVRSDERSPTAVCCFFLRKTRGCSGRKSIGGTAAEAQKGRELEDDGVEMLDDGGVH